MEETTKADETHWDSVLDTVDLLFTNVNDMDTNQQRFEVKQDMSQKILEQLLKDQQKLTKQMEEMGKAVAKLRLQQMKSSDEEPPSPTDSEDTIDSPFATHRSRPTGNKKPYQHGTSERPHGVEKLGNRGFLPKMNFPRFNGKDLGIWKAKCEDYFRLLDILESMWTMTASLHMSDNVERWMQMYKMKHGLVYKMKHGLGTYGSFIKLCKTSLVLMITNTQLMLSWNFSKQTQWICM
jgi:hypothetical protein